MRRLVETKWLAQHMDDPELVIIDASPSQEYLTTHIKNAVSASFDSEVYMSYGVNTSYGGGIDLFTDPGSPIPFKDGPPEYVGEIIRSLGINKDSTIVIYDNGANFHATRVFWTLSFHGLQKVYILNGGLEKWEMEGLPLTQETPDVEKGNFVPSVPDQSIVVHTDYVLDNLTNPEVLMVDSNLSSWYYGDFLAYSRRGHIPNAINVPYPTYFGDDKAWKPEVELREMFQILGVSPDKEIIVYCGGNPAASSLYFILRYVLGYPNVRFYLDSLIGWLSDPRDLPVHTYANEHILRDAEWLRWYAGERIQYLVRDSKVRTVDVRSREKYKAGHIPHAVNIAVEQMVYDSRISLRDWETVLGRNGIGVDHEVVIYDDGRNIFSNIFFWLMKYFGHKKVSILNGGLSAWSEKAFNVTLQDTIIAEPKHKFDIAIRPSSYSISLQRQMRLPNPTEQDAFGNLSKIWLISSSTGNINLDLPHYSTLVHVPYGLYLDKDGRIKDAGQILAIHESVGLSKFSEVVCYSESLHEATFSYLILQLMGYPKTRVFAPQSGIPS
jgi:thiosulfate/3-mercaptopyruvate sulfurtransferase